MERPVRIGTRSSPLALAQTALVERMLRSAHPGIAIEIVRISTLGDEIVDRPLAALGERAVFVTAIEDALGRGEIDFAVHSAKDLPSTLPAAMRIAAIPRRADSRDALVTGGPSLEQLLPGARIGTSAPRRSCQMRALRPDLALFDIRGNVDTRIGKLLHGEYDGVVLAMAGLDRLGIRSGQALIITPFTVQQMIPAAAQGALAIEACAARDDIAELLAPIVDDATTVAVAAERAFLGAVGGGCHAVVGASAQLEGATITIHGMVGALDGRQIRGQRGGARAEAVQLAQQLGRDLMQRGGNVLFAADGQA